MNIFDYFESIYCINRDDRPEKWEKCQFEFDKLGIKSRVRRISAIIWNEETTSEAACRASHKKAIQEAKDSCFRNVLIFEDDIEVVTLSGVAESIEELKQIDWKLFYLGGYPAYAGPFPCKCSKISKHLIKINQGYVCTHAYAINSSLFNSFLCAVSDMALDTWLAIKIQPNNLTVAVRELAIKQFDGFSDVFNCYKNRDVMVRRHAAMAKVVDVAQEDNVNIGETVFFI